MIFLFFNSSSINFLTSSAENSLLMITLSVLVTSLGSSFIISASFTLTGSDLTIADFSSFTDSRSSSKSIDLIISSNDVLPANTFSKPS